MVIVMRSASINKVYGSLTRASHEICEKIATTILGESRVDIYPFPTDGKKDKRILLTLKSICTSLQENSSNIAINIIYQVGIDSFLDSINRAYPTLIICSKRTLGLISFLLGDVNLTSLKSGEYRIFENQKADCVA